MNHKNSSRGFSVIEVILAAAMFMAFATFAVTAVLQGFDLNRLGAEQTIANQFAAEGLEAVKSIKNRAYSNLTIVSSADRGVNRPTNVWEFMGDSTNNILNSGKDYTRKIKVESVNRDASGNIVAIGCLDPYTKKITSTVNWNFNSARFESITLSSYLSDWRRSLPDRGGIIVYGESTNLIPRIRNYDSNTNSFSAECDVIADAAEPETTRAIASPTKQELILGYLASGWLHIMCYNGTAWTHEWDRQVFGGGNNRRFDIVYETNSGDVLVLFGIDTGGAQELGYRTKLGTSGCGSANWTPEVIMDSPGTNENIKVIRMVSDKRASSNLIAAVWHDFNNDLQAAIWNGNSWVHRTVALETNLECIGAAGCANLNMAPYDIEFESLSGDVMVVWGEGGSDGVNGAYYSTCTPAGASCTWLAKTAIPSLLDDATHIDISANPNTNQIVFASIGDAGGAASADLQSAYWSGTAWTGYPNQDITSTLPAYFKGFVATGWLINGGQTRYVIVYYDSAATNIGWFVGNPGSAPVVQTDFVPTPVFGTQAWYDIQMDPFNKDQLMLTVSDGNRDLFAKRLKMNSSGTFTSPDGWSNSDGGALETNLSSTQGHPFSFTYWR